MKKGQYNVLVKSVPGQEYIICDMIATKLSEKEVDEMRKYNDFLNDYRFIPYKETDFMWWESICHYLTKRGVYKGVYFDIDYFGYVSTYTSLKSISTIVSLPK